MAPTFVLDLRDLDAAGKALNEPIPPTWLRGALEGTDLTVAGEEGRVTVRYSRSGNDIIVHGRAQAKVQTPCARCLQPVTLPLDVELSLMLVPAESPRADFARGKKGAAGQTAGEYEVKSSDAEFDTYDGDEVNLDPFVREALLLEVPPFPLCSEDCRGIAPPPSEEGPAREIDPRLAPLLKFKKPGN